MQSRLAVLGASGYTGVELTKLLDVHPDVELAVASSDRWVGDTLAARTGVRSQLRYSPLEEAVEQAKRCDVVLLATPAEASHDLVPRLVEHARVIDLSGAYRLKNPALVKKYYGFEHQHVGLLKEAAYGLPELFRERLAGARLIANPGCYATAIQLALAPLVANSMQAAPPPASRGGAAARAAASASAAGSGRKRSTTSPMGEPSTKPFSRVSPADDMLEGRIIVDAMSGVTGAGRKATEEMSFAEVTEDVRAYRVLKHQHTPEIEQGLSELAERDIDVTFIPHLLPVKRGILATCHVQYLGKHDVVRLYKFAYSGEPFISIAPSAEQVALKDVVGTNQCRIGISIGDNGELVVISAIDNLVKGAAGQAVQNLNLLLGLDEQAGLGGLRSFHP